MQPLLSLLLPLLSLSSRAYASPVPVPAPAVAAAAASATPTCAQGVMVIAARGSDGNWHQGNVTDPNYGDIGGLQAIANAVVKAVGKGSFVQAVPYPASLDDYFTSLGLGVTAVQGMIRNYTDKCKAKVTPRIVLLGYSQGAQVMSQALVGGNGQKALGSAYVKSIVAGSIFADPSFLNGVHPIDAGSDKNSSGIFRMDDTTAAKFNTTYGKILRSYCQYGDFFCSSGSGPDAMSIHGAAVQTYTTASENFLLPIVKKYA